MTKSYRPMFRFGSDETQGNAQRFATYDEAENSARNRFLKWTMPTDYFVEESDDEVNYRWDPERGDVSI